MAAYLNKPANRSGGQAFPETKINPSPPRLPQALRISSSMNLIPLPSLPATNENVVHLHGGIPTPHREGVVAKCEVETDGRWFANAQPDNLATDMPTKSRFGHVRMLI